MSALLDRIKAAGIQARLRFVKLLNRFAALISGAIFTLNQADPSIWQQTGLPSWTLIPLGVIWFLVIEYATKQHNSNQNPQ